MSAHAAPAPLVRHATMPEDPTTLRVVEQALDDWWAGLDPAQRATVHTVALVYGVRGQADYVEGPRPGPVQPHLGGGRFPDGGS